VRALVRGEGAKRSGEGERKDALAAMKGEKRDKSNRCNEERKITEGREACAERKGDRSGV
jgi:hypothetical protein